MGLMHKLCTGFAACLVAAVCTGSGFSADEASLGDFRPAPALTLYLPASQTQTDLRLAFRRAQTQEGDRLMVRLFNPDEKLAYWQYFEPGMILNQNAPGDGEIAGIPLDMTVKPKAGTLLAELDLKLNAPGVWQLRVSSGSGNSIARILASQPLKYGVSFQNGTFSPWDKTLKEAYLYIPPHARKLILRGGPVQIFDENGKELTTPVNATTAPKEAYNYAAKPLEIPVAQTGVVWKFVFPDPANWSLRLFGLPAILCPDAQTANEIKGSIEILPDGTTVCHKFQREVMRLLPGILAKAGSSEELLGKLFSRKEEWLKTPQRNQHLLGPYSIWPVAAEALKEQNIDPASHWAGSVKAWKTLQDKPAPDNRWDNYLSTPGTWAGLSAGVSYGEALAEIWATDAPFNALYQNEALLYRATAVAFADLLDIGEDEAFRGVEADLDSYPGFMAFAISRKNFPEFSLLAAALPPEIRAVWTDGLRRVVDRHYPDGLVTCRNQSSHYLVGWQQFALGSGDPRYQDLSVRYAQRYIEGQAPGGYGIESAGPDASYTGMQHWHMALAQRLSDNPQLLEAIRRSYNFYNHTVAPEPDGKIVGGFNFGHRIGNSFSHEQWGGARGILDDRLPEVALWRQYSGKTTLEQATRTIEQTFAKGLPQPASPITDSVHFRYWTDKPLSGGQLPAMSGKDFIHEIGGELIGVKRPGYYVAIFVGKPAPVPHYVMGKENIRHPRPDADENNGATPPGRSKYNTPFLGGGLTLFWSPAYGSAFAATNWSPYTHHGLIAVKPDHTRWWEDYFATSYKLDQTAGTLAVSGKIEGLPLRYVRHYSFLPDRLAVRVELTADEACKLEKLSENFPFVAGAPKTGGVKLLPDPAEEAGKWKGFALECRGVQTKVVFAEPTPTQTCEKGLNDPGNYQLNRVEAELPRDWATGQKYTFAYELIPVAQ